MIKREEVVAEKGEVENEVRRDRKSGGRIKVSRRKGGRRERRGDISKHINSAPDTCKDTFTPTQTLNTHKNGS